MLSILGVGHSINLSPIFFVPSGSNIDTVEFAVYIIRGVLLLFRERKAVNVILMENVEAIASPSQGVPRKFGFLRH